MHETSRETKRHDRSYSLRHTPGGCPDRGQTLAGHTRFAQRAMLQPSLEEQRVSNPLVQGLHPSFTVRVSRRGARMPIVLRGLSMLVALAAIGSGCSGPAHDTGPLFGIGVIHPPPKPGDSIAHSQMCECKTCDPVNCCDGPDDDAPPAQCGDSYDFSASDSCGGLSVKSCSSRCTRQIWRVRSAQDCAEKRPASCCHAG
jgi:hypothetical protein